MNPYDLAIQMSRDGEEFFRALAKQVKKPALRKVLATLANDQAIHRREFEEMKETPEGRSLPEVRSKSEVPNPFARRLKGLDRGDKIDENVPLSDLYRRGQELDEECEDFFLKRAARVKDTRLKLAYLGFAEQQRKHYFMLENIITFIAEPQPELEDGR